MSKFAGRLLGSGILVASHTKAVARHIYCLQPTLSSIEKKYTFRCSINIFASCDSEFVHSALERLIGKIEQNFPPALGILQSRHAPQARQVACNKMQLQNCTLAQTSCHRPLELHRTAHSTKTTPSVCIEGGRLSLARLTRRSPKQRFGKRLEIPETHFSRERTSAQWFLPGHAISFCVAAHWRRGRDSLSPL